jgi:hypothetical protein
VEQIRPISQVNFSLSIKWSGTEFEAMIDMLLRVGNQPHLWETFEGASGDILRAGDKSAAMIRDKLKGYVKAGCANFGNSKLPQFEVAWFKSIADIMPCCRFWASPTWQEANWPSNTYIDGDPPQIYGTVDPTTGLPVQFLCYMRE